MAQKNVKSDIKSLKEIISKLLRKIEKENMAPPRRRTRDWARGLRLPGLFLHPGPIWVWAVQGEHPIRGCPLMRNHPLVSFPLLRSGA